MTDNKVSAIQQTAERLLNSKAGRTLDVGMPAHLALLVEAARPIATDADEDTLWTVVAMCWLGPHRAGVPPVFMREQLFELLRQYAAGDIAKSKFSRMREQLFELLRQYAPDERTRLERVAVAQANRWLAAHVVNFPKAGSQIGGSSGNLADWSDTWLLGTRFVCPEKAFKLQDDEVLALACTTRGIELLATEQGYQFFVPPGAKALWTVQECAGAVELSHGQTLPLPAPTTVLLIARDDDVILKAATEGRERQARLRIGDSATLTGPATLSLRECTCGTTHCIERRRLASWNPLQPVQKTDADEDRSKREGSLTLWDCLASAVKGPQAAMKTGAFVQGMYFPLLAQEGLHS